MSLLAKASLTNTGSASAELQDCSLAGLKPCNQLWACSHQPTPLPWNSFLLPSSHSKAWLNSTTLCFFFPSEPPRMENTRQSYFKNQQMTQPLGVESGILNSSTALCRRSSGGGLTVPELHPTSSYSHLTVKNGCFFLPHPLSDPEVLSPLFYPAIGFLFSLLANQSIRGTSPTEM